MPGGCASLTHPTGVAPHVRLVRFAYPPYGRAFSCSRLTKPSLRLLRLRNKPASGARWVAIARGNRHNAPARLTTLSMGALLVLPQRYSVYQVRSGRKQPRQMTCVPGCSWQGPHPFQASVPRQPSSIRLVLSICFCVFRLLPQLFISTLPPGLFYSVF